MRKLLAFLAVVSVAACDSRIGSSFVSPATPSIVGKYVAQTVNGSALPAITAQTGASTTTIVVDTLTFGSDGSVIHAFVVAIAAPPGSVPVQQPEIVNTGTYVLTNGALTLLFPNNAGGTDAFTGTQSGATITINGGNIFIYRKISG
jgi:hypothetical protein